MNTLDTRLFACLTSPTPFPQSAPFNMLRIVAQRCAAELVGTHKSRRRQERPCASSHHSTRRLARPRCSATTDSNGVQSRYLTAIRPVQVDHYSNSTQHVGPHFDERPQRRHRPAATLAGSPNKVYRQCSRPLFTVLFTYRAPACSVSAATPRLVLFDLVHP
jgi:hypothetical protein